MFLRRLETIGFKSFADRITIEYVPGITTIVGPNGSGKSNVIDAIRWVLGEQSVRSLRGERMEDIIFQGSETRNPLNFAEVSLLLNNENKQLPIDYQEVKVTRRVYRSGESEFLINKQACRLKDIVDLFTDTGLGRESFSIIGQGKIDEILRSKADERRAIFEEAAGVMRYKRRKEQATYKLAETEDNLSRVEDIIYEIKQQIVPLAKQAAVAEQYNTLKTTLTKQEISLLVTEIHTLHSKWSQLVQNIEIEEMTHIEQQTKLQQLEANIVKKRESAQQLETDINSLQNSLVNVTEQLEQTEGKRNVFIEQQKHREENKRHLIVEKNNVQTELKETKKSLQKESDQLSSIKDKLIQLQEEINEVESKLYTRHDEIDKQIESLKADYIEQLNDKAVAKNESKVLMNRKERVKQTLFNHEQKQAHLEEKSEIIVREKKELQTTIQQRRVTIESEHEKLTRIKESINEQEKLFDEKQRTWYDTNDKITKLSSRKEMLIEMKENFKGFAYGVKEILQASKNGHLSNIIGPVIDLINVPSKLMVAIDTILGAQAQYIVVPNDQTARTTINWLKKEGKGRATFLPLQSIVTRFIPTNIRSQIERERGFIGMANELVSVDDRYERITAHLMGNVIVTETLRDANVIADKTNRRYRIVTLAGDVVFPGGSISGGAQRKRNFSLFTREQEIEQLTTEIDKYKKINRRVTSILSEKQASITTMKEEIESRSEQLTITKQTYQQLLNKQHEYYIKSESLDDQITSYRIQHKEYVEEIDSLNEHIQQNNKTLKQAKETIMSIEQTIDLKTTEQNTLLLDKQSNEQKLHELQIKNAEYQERYKNNDEKVTTLNAHHTSLQQKLTKVNHDLQQIINHEQKDEPIEMIDENIGHLREERESITKQITDLQQRRKEMLQTIEDKRHELKSQQKIHEQFSAEIQEKQVEASRLDVTLENRLQTLQTQYTITFEKAAQQYEKITNVGEVSEQVQQIKQKIKSLGSVNLGAIKEYDRLSNREDFLNEQRKDLIEAKETLYDAIQKMDEEMITRFKTTFESIQAAFTTVFKQLFGGGHAELRLTEPDNYLETGIDIIAQPPGKKMKTLELLSGGERALTAITLLFAILRARPVPFVILDEVDATLDEANVERFASYLKTFSEESQFIVISHRKGTMEVADALYGVTMQESGVSRFVSVRLEETDHLVASS